jgi:hypothetical protein
MKRSITRVAVGVLGLGLMVSITGCPKKPVPPELMSRIDAAANKAEAAANKAAASAQSASNSAAAAEAAAAKIGTRGYEK